MHRFHHVTALWIAICLCTGLGAILPTSALAQEANPEQQDRPLIVRFKTSLGPLDVELFDERTPGTVKNFLRLVNEKAYDGCVFHRLIPGFVIQGGGFYIKEDEREQIFVKEVPDHGPVKNEPGISNTIGTIAMAKLGGDPDSATNQFFFSLGNNSANLDEQNGGFTVFGEVLKKDLPLLKKLGELERGNAGGPFSDLPLKEVPDEPKIELKHLLFIESIRVLDEEGTELEPNASGDDEAAEDTE